jgi:hypothetical protein
MPNKDQDYFMEKVPVAPITGLKDRFSIVWGVTRIRFHMGDGQPEKQPRPRPMSRYAADLLEELFKEWH